MLPEQNAQAWQAGACATLAQPPVNACASRHPAVLLVKTSSLGDIVANLPLVADIRRWRPDAAIDWVVEEA